MKQLLIFLTISLFLNQCKKADNPNDGDPGEEKYTQHFHYCANKVSGGFELNLNLPQLISEKKVYLKSIKPIGAVFNTSQDIGPIMEDWPEPEKGESTDREIKGQADESKEENKGEYRDEIVSVALQFTTNVEEALPEEGGNNYKWDPECNNLTLTTQMDEETINRVRYTSIYLFDIPGIRKIKYGEGKGSDYDKSCFEIYENCPKPPTEMQSSFFFFHPGHQIPGGPEFGDEGIYIND